MRGFLVFLESLCPTGNFVILSVFCMPAKCRMWSGTLLPLGVLRSGSRVFRYLSLSTPCLMVAQKVGVCVHLTMILDEKWQSCMVEMIVFVWQPHRYRVKPPDVFAVSPFLSWSVLVALSRDKVTILRRGEIPNFDNKKQHNPEEPRCFFVLNSKKLTLE